VSGQSSPGDAVERVAGLEAKVEELRRVNAELGRELRQGAASGRPRTPVTAARALAKLANERDIARDDLERTEAELAETKAGLEMAERGVADLSQRFEGLSAEAERLRHEVARLRSGRAGLLRRLRARLLPR
jgi:chromosome segregation ATPase